jgi:hypothetical protein
LSPFESVGASKLGGDANVTTPVAGLIVNADASAPPLMM